MALKKRNTPVEEPQDAKPTTRLRKGNPEPDTPPAVEEQGPEAEVITAPEPEETTKEVAISEKKAVGTVATGGGVALGGGGGLGLKSPYDSLEGNIPPGELEFGSIPRYTASNGQILNSDKKSIGSWMQFEPVSFNELYMVATGKNDDESKDYLRFSYDGENCTDGRTLMTEALENAVAAGYKDASIKKYLELFGILLSAEKLSDNDPALNKLVMMSLAPQSVKAWNGFKFQAGVQVKLGRWKLEDLKLVTATVVVKTFGDNTFSMFEFDM